MESFQSKLETMTPEKKKLNSPIKIFKAQQKKKKKKKGKLISITEKKPYIFSKITQKFNLQRCKKLISNTKSPNLYNEITISYGDEAKNITEQMDVDEPMDSHLQDEILMNILKRLPVRSLLRFKCVSKVWKTLISDPYFKMTHLNHAKNYQNPQKFLISHLCPKDDIYSMFSLPLSSFQPVENVQKLDFPLISKAYRCTLTCTCDGLVIIILNDNIDVERSIYLLWNPSIGESIVLPGAHLPQEQCSRLGLGYDPTSGDYKFLKIHPDIDSPGEILALKSGSWRNIDKHPRGICSDIEGIHYLSFVNEAFHWIGISGSYSVASRNYSVASRNYSVVSFSISNEVYGEIPLPEQILGLRGDISIGVAVLDGMLCVHSTSVRQRKDSFTLWVLKDYGVKESWSALSFVLDDPGLFRTIPKYRFEDGEVLFWGIRFDCSGHSFRTSKGPFRLWPRCDAVQIGITFTESLISPKSLI